MINIIYIGLGSNIGNKAGQVQLAREMIDKIRDLEVTGASSLYLTYPWGNTEQEDFVNQVIEVRTGLSALDLLYRLQEIEIKMGRQRNVRWGPRSIDLDILLYGDEIIHLPELRVPHPHMRERLFVLIPLQEINPELVFPEDGVKLKEVLINALDREGNRGIRKI
ncbi:MAG: 2-amino-4-hydroxy-6-hydroxymethyldihydropteridine diphosphokinase [Syntrophomonadaceae bacterium]|nr:2-amino-4-hydroxy-6-hydroxymethyldihydropteridine diphosphokinase [Syntrophomonadaceae bacterium]MDD3272168.1 2-amino-4-hydroxy-6-hydroxymethyldihydropteridine diphosphokinase [Syntrophomonadaceae bacterium]MDD3898712.1 2-amino-4-hydroxy-6-hydroxymethyldihydropteridine diphosphokinase [Syntrophomonadaceae bacterium]MDD4562225.1 2-amino-4-hydroxy-6-hydroxymethyldihydropteridine diphosphokinase [Syntrophomonadaceae bacterium]